jgi:ferredoxin/biotin operon repressor
VTTDEAYLRLAAEKNRKPDSKLLPEILKLAMTPEEARFLLELPAPTADVAAKLNMDEKAVEDKIRNLAQRGLVTRSRKGYRYPGSLGTLHDNILASAPEFIPDGIGQLWMQMYEGGWWQEIASELGMVGMPALRTILPMKTAPKGVELLPCESIEALIQARKDLITVRNCCCRVGEQSASNSKCTHPVFTCTQFGGRAEYDLYRGSGRKVSADEAMDIALKATDGGLVPTVTNMSPMEALEFICYCCGDACLVLNPTIRAGNVLQVLAPSRFLPRVDNDKCNGCGECVPRCFFDAIVMKEVPGSNTPKAVIDMEKCLGCALCMNICGPEAVTMELAKPPEFIPETITGPSAIVH